MISPHAQDGSVSFDDLKHNLRLYIFSFFSSRRRHTRLQGDWSSDVCSSDLGWAPTDLPCPLYTVQYGVQMSKAEPSGAMSRERILRAAAGVIEREGALSMRRLAQIGRASCRERV